VPRCAVQTEPLLFTKFYAEIFNHSKKFNIATRPSSATASPLFPRGGVSLYLKKALNASLVCFFFCRYHSFSNDLLFVRKTWQRIYTSRLRLWHILYIVYIYVHWHIVHTRAADFCILYHYIICTPNVNTTNYVSLSRLPT